MLTFVTKMSGLFLWLYNMLHPVLWYLLITRAFFFGYSTVTKFRLPPFFGLYGYALLLLFANVLASG